jgi:hypothetical protein
MNHQDSDSAPSSSSRAASSTSSAAKNLGAPVAPTAPPPGLWATIVSVSAAFFGVQSERNRERDFQSGKPIVFILVGLGMTIGFIAMVWFAVQMALKNAGAE